MIRSVYNYKEDMVKGFLNRAYAAFACVCIAAAFCCCNLSSDNNTPDASSTSSSQDGGSASQDTSKDTDDDNDDDNDDVDDDDVVDDDTEDCSDTAEYSGSTTSFEKTFCGSAFIITDDTDNYEFYFSDDLITPNVAVGIKLGKEKYSVFQLTFDKQGNTFILVATGGGDFIGPDVHFSSDTGTVDGEGLLKIENLQDEDVFKLLLSIEGKDVKGEDASLSIKASGSIDPFPE